MILRVLRYTLRPGCSVAFEAALATHTVPALRASLGLRFGWGGRCRDDEPGGVYVTGWDTFEAMVAASGGRVDEPAFQSTEANAMIRECDVSHWEALDLDPVPWSEPSILRIAHASVNSLGESTYFGYLRSEVSPVLSGVNGLAGVWFGRQVDRGTVDPFIIISMWRSVSDLHAAGGDDGPVFAKYSGEILELGDVELFDAFGPALTIRVEPATA